jgi:hypothetical protein
MTLCDVLTIMPDMNHWFFIGKKERHYCGVDRDSLFYDDSEQEDHPFNRMFLEHLDGRTQSAEEAKTVLDIANRHKGPVYDIIEVSTAPNTTGMDRLLGYDVANGWSMITMINYMSTADYQPVTAFDTINLLFTRYFRQKLNRHGLFDNREDAEFCLKCTLDFNELQPTRFENRELLERLQVLSIYTFLV